MRVVHWLVIVCLFSSSCDLILNFHLGGSLRLCQVLMGFVLMASVAHCIQHGRILWARGASGLLIWLLGQMLFLPRSGALTLAMQFFVLLTFTVLCVFALVQLYGKSVLIDGLMKAYLSSFVFVAFFGLLQFTLPLVGLPSPLVQQWISIGRIARINGFSYEPSYFATYMIMGWIMLTDLRRSGAAITTGRGWKLGTAVVSISLILSTSKTAWLFIMVELLARVAPSGQAKLGRRIRGIASGRLLIGVPRLHVVSGILALPLFAAVGLYQIRTVVDPLVFLSGTGLANTPAHSLNSRLSAAVVTMDTFRDSPWLGRSLGGVPIAIAARGGIQVGNMEQLRLFWGFPVLLDVLVASGIIGFIPFAWFVWLTTAGALRLAAARWPEERARWVRALGRAMIFEWLILMTDQNLLRTYLWFHISMVMVVAYSVEHSMARTGREPLPALGPSGTPLFLSEGGMVVSHAGSRVV